MDYSLLVGIHEKDARNRMNSSSDITKSFNVTKLFTSLQAHESLAEIEENSKNKKPMLSSTPLDAQDFLPFHRTCDGGLESADGTQMFEKIILFFLQKP